MKKTCIMSFALLLQSATVTLKWRKMRKIFIYWDSEEKLHLEKIKTSLGEFQGTLTSPADAGQHKVWHTDDREAIPMSACLHSWHKSLSNSPESTKVPPSYHNTQWCLNIISFDHGKVTLKSQEQTQASSYSQQLVLVKAMLTPWVKYLNFFGWKKSYPGNVNSLVYIL